MSYRATSSVLVLLCLLAGNGWAQEPTTCTKVLDPHFPLPLLADGINLVETLWAEIDGEEGRDLIAVGRTLNRDLVILHVPTQEGEGSVSVLARIEGPIPSAREDDRLVQPADVNGDGLDDLLVLLADWSAPLVTLVNDDGVFREAGPRIPCARLIRPGDYDGDGADELFALTCSGSDSSYDLWEFTGDHLWEIRSELSDQLNTGSHASGDYDRDGNDDFVSFSSQPGFWARDLYFGDPETPLVSRHRTYNSGQPWSRAGFTFQEHGVDGFIMQFARKTLARFDSDPWVPGSLRKSWTGEYQGNSNGRIYTVEDIDGDGWIDISFLIEWQGKRTNQFLRGLGPLGGFVPVWTDELLGRRLIGGADVDHDGENEGLFYRWYTDGIAAFDKDDSGGFTDAIARFPSVVESRNMNGASSGDFTNDGIEDILLWPSVGNRPKVLRGDGSGSFDLVSELAPSQGYFLDVHVADMDDDQILDLVIGGAYPSGISSWFGRGDGTFSAGQQILFPHFPKRLLVGDINQDGEADYLYADNGGNRFLAVFARDATLFKGPETLLDEYDDRRFEPFDLADVNGDGTLDLIGSVERGSSRFELAFHPLLMDGRLAPGTTAWTGYFPAKPQKVDAVDLDRDGDIDLFVQMRRGLARTNATLLNDGHGQFVLTWSGPERSPFSEGFYDLIDIDNDGHLDLIEREHGFRVRLGNGTGVFETSLGAWGSGAEEEDLIVDVNGDGIVDIVRWETSHTGRDRGYAQGAGEFAATDSTPPVVELALWPAAHRFDGIREWDQARFHVGVVATDDCSQATLTLRRLDMPLVGPESEVLFAAASRETVAIYENPTTGLRQVLLTGLEELESRRRFSEVRAAGGWDLPNGHLMTLMHTPGYGPEPENPAVDASSRRTALFQLGVQLPTAAITTHPTEEISFSAAAIDKAGHTTSVIETFSSGTDRYCRLPNAVPSVCN